jgi:hypothetical protein
MATPANERAPGGGAAAAVPAAAAPRRSALVLVSLIPVAAVANLNLAVANVALPDIGRAAGRYYIDVTSGVTPKQFIRGEWFVSIALLTGIVWVLCAWAGLNTWWSAGVAFVVGFSIRILALYRGWEEPLAREPAGVYQQSDGRPLLGCKLKGKSVREMRDLGLLVEDGDASPVADSKVKGDDG